MMVIPRAAGWQAFWLEADYTITGWLVKTDVIFRDMNTEAASMATQIGWN
jgi:hypothetical protein